MNTDKKNELEKIAKELGEDYVKDINEMSSEEIDELCHLAAEGMTEEAKKLGSLPSNAPNVLVQPPEDYNKSLNESREEEGIAKDGKVIVDPITGLTNIVKDNGDQYVSDKTIIEVLDDDKNLDDVKMMINSNLGGDVDEKTILEIMEFMKKVENENPIELYPILPEAIKKMINATMIGATSKQKESAAIEFMNMLKNDVLTSADFVDIQESINKEMKMNVADLYLDHINYIMTEKLEDSARNIRNDDPVKSKKLLLMKQSFIESYTYTPLLKKIEHHKKINKVLTKDIKKLAHYCTKFNATYLRTKFVIDDSRLLINILDRHLPAKYDLAMIKKFIVLLLKVFKKLDNTVIEEHVYMYYSIKLIRMLDNITSQDGIMYRTIINNICRVINAIEGAEIVELEDLDIRVKAVYVPEFDNASTEEKTDSTPYVEVGFDDEKIEEGE